MRRFVSIAACLAVSWVVGCGGCEAEERAPRELPPEVPPALPVTPEEVYAPDESADDESTRYRVEPAFMEDREYDRATPVEARRLVYRVSLRVPRSLGDAPDTHSPPTAELYLDLSADRLRARFAGNGWPVPAGSEVRLRRDQGGVYVFDDHGGRPLGPGQLSSWFEGGRLRRDPTWRVRPPSTRGRGGNAEMICRFIAEWANQPPDQVVRRCGEEGTPPSFRVGLWRAERTADIPVELPRRSLRSDQEGAPAAIPHISSRAYLTPALLRTLRPPRRRRTLPEGHRPGADPPPEGLRVHNTGRARMIVTVEGSPVGWIDAGETGYFVGLEPGIFSVGGMRPFGLQTARKRNVAVPATVSLPR